MNNMTVRILFGLFAVPTFLLAIYYPQSRDLFMGALVIVAVWEYARMIQEKFAFPLMKTVLPILSAIMLATSFIEELRVAKDFLFALFMVLILFLHFKKVDIENLFPTFALNAFGFWFFSIWFFDSWVEVGTSLGRTDWNPHLFLMISMWLSDTFAYFAGKFLGKKKLCPTISPKKTWAGAVGGALGTTIFGVFCGGPLLELPYLVGGLLALGLSITAQLGDLFFSSTKRYTGIKDSSNIFPGHGGVLDRFDSLFLAAPIFVGIIKIYSGV